MKKYFFLTICLTIIQLFADAQSKNQYNLAQLYKDNKLTVVNREIVIDKDPSRNGIIQKEDFDEGLAWINGVSFSTGTIEIDLRGQNVAQHSFVGVAFHGSNDSTFDAIYFRPFQFLTFDSTGKAHCIQYISLPDYPWRRLREEHNGVYENILDPAPDPDNWFHVKIIVKEDEAAVYVNNATTACMKISLLGKNKTGKIGLYTADRSGGSFANLSIQNN